MSLRLLPIFLETAAAPGPGSMLGMFLPLILVMGIMYFLMIRPQKKKEQALRDQLNQMKVGDDVITIGGIVGRVFSIQEDEVTIATSVYKTHLTFKKSAINHIISHSTTESSAKTTEKSVPEDEEKPKKFGFHKNKKSHDDE